MNEWINQSLRSRKKHWVLGSTDLAKHSPMNHVSDHASWSFMWYYTIVSLHLMLIVNSNISFCLVSFSLLLLLEIKGIELHYSLVIGIRSKISRRVASDAAIRSQQQSQGTQKGRLSATTMWSRRRQASVLKKRKRKLCIQDTLFHAQDLQDKYFSGL